MSKQIISTRIAQSVPLPLGKTMGGGSTLNGMQYVRGSPQDFDNWAFLGNTGWDYASVLPYYKKIENYRGKISRETGRLYISCLYKYNRLSLVFTILFILL